MFILNKKNVVSLILALIISGGYLWAVFTPPSVFNMLPVTLYESRTSDPHFENTFIIQFDIFFAVVVLILSYILARNFFTTFGYFSEKKEKAPHPPG